MRNLIGALLIFNVYFIIYYRLMLRFYAEQQTGHKESIFGAIFSFPSLKLLPEKARKYFKRYWIAIGLMLLGVGYLASTSQLIPTTRLSGLSYRSGHSTTAYGGSQALPVLDLVSNLPFRSRHRNDNTSEVPG